MVALRIEYRVGRFVLLIDGTPVGYWTGEELDDLAEDLKEMRHSGAVILHFPDLSNYASIYTESKSEE